MAMDACHENNNYFQNYLLNSLDKLILFLHTLYLLDYILLLNLSFVICCNI